MITAVLWVQVTLHPAFSSSFTMFTELEQGLVRDLLRAGPTSVTHFLHPGQPWVFIHYCPLSGEASLSKAGWHLRLWVSALVFNCSVGQVNPEECSPHGPTPPIPGLLARLPGTGPFLLERVLIPCRWHLFFCQHCTHGQCFSNALLFKWFLHTGES